MYKTISNLFYLLALTIPVAAQNTTAYQQDTAKVMQLIYQADRYRFTKPDSCLPVAHKALELAQSLKFRKGEANAHLTFGEYHRVTGNFPEALQHLFTAHRISKEIKNTAVEGNSLTFIGIVYLALEEFRTALDYLFQAYEINKSRPDVNVTSFGLVNTGVAYRQLGMLDSALIYQNKAWKVGKNSPLRAGISFMLREIGITYALQHKYDSAFYYYRYALSISKDVLNAGRIYSRTAMLYDQMNKPDSVLHYARLALSHGQNSLEKVTMLEASKILTKYFIKEHKPDSVIRYQELNMALQDSLFGRKQLQKLQLLAIEEQKRIHDAEQRQRQIEQEQTEYRNRIRLYSLLTASVVLLILGLILFRNNRQKQKAKLKIEKAYQELKQTQTQLIQSEKMASLGELTAGIAHEIQNPLNFVNNFSDVNTELIEEMKQELKAGNNKEGIAIADEVAENEQKINHHGKRADAIVKGMLQHSRSTTSEKESTDINKLADEYLRLCYHGLRAKDPFFNATMQTHFDQSLEKINIIPQDIGRVLLNLFTNAFYSVTEKKKVLQPSEGGALYEPTVSVSTKKEIDKAIITIRDNGLGLSLIHI